MDIFMVMGTRTPPLHRQRRLWGIWWWMRIMYICADDDIVGLRIVRIGGGSIFYKDSRLLAFLLNEEIVVYFNERKIKALSKKEKGKKKLKNEQTIIERKSTWCVFYETYESMLFLSSLFTWKIDLHPSILPSSKFLYFFSLYRAHPQR